MATYLAPSFTFFITSCIERSKQLRWNVLHFDVFESSGSKFPKNNLLDGTAAINTFLFYQTSGTIYKLKEWVEKQNHIVTTYQIQFGKKCHCSK